MTFKQFRKLFTDIKPINLYDYFYPYEIAQINWTEWLPKERESNPPIPSSSGISFDEDGAVVYIKVSIKLLDGSISTLPMSRILPFALTYQFAPIFKYYQIVLREMKDLCEQEQAYLNRKIRSEQGLTNR